MKKQVKQLLALMLVVLLLCMNSAVALDVDGLIAQAEEFCQTGDVKRALACLELAERASPHDARVDLIAADIFLEMNDTQNALQSVESALTKEPLSAQGWLMRCRCDLLLEDSSALERDLLYAEICGAQPSEQDAAAFGLMFAKTMKNEQAIDWFEEAGMDALDATQRSAYGRALIAAGRRQEATELGLTNESWRDSALQAAFEKNTLTVKETVFNWADCRIANYSELNLPAGLYQSEAAEMLSMMQKELSEGSRQVISLSPAGNTALVSLGDYIYAMHDNVIRPFIPHEERGIAVSDLKQPYTGMERHNKKSLGIDGVVWSHDGRYAVMANFENFMKGISWDLSLLDTWYGDEVILESFGKAKDWGALCNACFSLDDNTLYYTLYTRSKDREHPIWLCRCNLDTMEMEYMYSSGITEEKSSDYYPGLFILDDGSLIALSQPGPMHRTIGHGVVRVLPDGERLLYRVPYEEVYLESTRLFYSENSREALAVMVSDMDKTEQSSTLSQLAMLIALQPEMQNGEEDLQPLVLRCQIVNDTLQLFVEPLDKVAVSKLEDEAAQEWRQSVLDIMNICLSPDGYYALAVVHSQKIDNLLLNAGLISERTNRPYLIMIDLENREAKMVTQDQNQPLELANSAIRLCLEWNGDSLVYQDRNGFGILNVQ